MKNRSNIMKSRKHKSADVKKPARFKVTLEKESLLWHWTVVDLEAQQSGNLNRRTRYYGVSMTETGARRRARSTANKVRRREREKRLREILMS